MFIYFFIPSFSRLTSSTIMWKSDNQKNGFHTSYLEHGGDLLHVHTFAVWSSSSFPCSAPSSSLASGNMCCKMASTETSNSRLSLINFRIVINSQLQWDDDAWPELGLISCFDSWSWKVRTNWNHIWCKWVNLSAMSLARRHELQLIFKLYPGYGHCHRLNNWLLISSLRWQEAVLTTRILLSTSIGIGESSCAALLSLSRVLDTALVTWDSDGRLYWVCGSVSLSKAFVISKIEETKRYYVC